VGLLFLFVSIWIALGAVVGRYHYALDVLTGVAIALAVFLACYPYL
jgi:membrane-associated phospholipid phosphatase